MEAILQTINSNLGECKLLDEWQKLVNDSLPPLKRLRKRSFTHLVGSMSREGHFMLTKEISNKNIYYRFE